MKILFFGDIMGRPGREALRKILPKLRAKYEPDLVLANVENLAHGKGITLSTIQELLDAGVDFFTSGNHVFDKPEAVRVFAQHPDRIIRPANLEADLPGLGFRLITVKGQPVLLINLLGQVFMKEQFDQGTIRNPFLELRQILEQEGPRAKIKLLDFHAEATSEKRAMGFWADGQMSAVFGTHTHIPTNDAQVLPLGTGYLTDVGMVGAADSIIGVLKDRALGRFLAEATNGAKTALDIPETEIYEVDYLFLEIDDATGKCQNIESARLVI